MSHEQNRSAKPRESRMKSASIVVLVIGSLLLIASISSFAVVLPTPYGGAIIIGIGIGIILLFVGSIMYFIGRNQEKEQRDLDEGYIQSERKDNIKNKMKTAGSTLLITGLIGVFISALWMAACWGVINNVEGALAFGIGLILFIIAFLIAVIGAILFLLGQSQQKKQKNQNKSLD